MPDDLMNDEPNAAAENLAATLAGAENTEAPDFMAGFGDDEPDISPDTPEEETPEILKELDEPEPEPEAEDEDDDFPDTAPGKGSDAAQKGWKEIKSELKKTRAELRAEREKVSEELKAREAELEALRKQVAELPELQEKAKLAEDAEKELAVARVEGTREYKDTIEKPLRAIEDAAALIAKTNGLKLDDLLDALVEPDAATQKELLKEIISGLDAIDSNDVVAMSREARVLLSKRAEIRARATEAKKELEQITREKETQAQKKAREDFETATDHAVAELKKRVPIVPLAEGESADTVFSSVLAKARATDFDTATPSNKAFAAAAAVLLPRMAKQNVHLQAEVKKLQARIAEGNKTRPTVHGGDAPPPTKDVDFMDEVFGSSGAASPFKFV